MTSTIEMVSHSNTKSSMFIFYRTQLEIVKEWNRTFNWGFTEGDFYALGNPPEIPEQVRRPGKFYAVVLDIKFETVEETFNNFWKAILSVDDNSHKWGGLASDITHLYTTEGVNHVPGLSWKVIEINSGIGRSVEELKSDPSISLDRLASSSAFWMVAYFMKWSADHHGGAFPNLFVPKHHLCVPGYKVKLPTSSHYTDSVFMRWDITNGNLVLDVANTGYKSKKWITPILLNI